VSYRLEIDPLAMGDIGSAAYWYEQREEGLGERFTREVIETIDQLVSTPLAYRLRHRRLGVRWCMPRHFPYRIIYRVSDDLITVIAVIHAARHHSHWKKR